MTKLILTYSFLFAIASFAQDKEFLTDYEPLKAEGKIPLDFQMNILDRLNNDDPSKYDVKNSENYVLKKSEYITDLVESGIVLFGDKITKYIERIGNKVAPSELKKELRYYTVQSNDVNAFVNGDGMVFVTIGLISKLKSESDLAFVLAHEISHHTESHILKTYDNFNSRSRLITHNSKNRLYQLSNYSKNHEFEADKLGYELYIKAGYDPSKISQAFDLLSESERAIDSLKINNSYFELSKIGLDSLTKVSDNIFTREDNRDDEYSSHPNVSKRRLELQNLRVDNFSSLINDSKDDLYRVVETAKFERIRNHMHNYSLIEALYEIELLKAYYPNNEFLKKKEFIIWNNIAQIITKNKRSKLFDSKKYYDELHIFNEKIKQLTDSEILKLSALKTKNEIQDLELNNLVTQRVKNCIKNSTNKVSHDSHAITIYPTNKTVKFNTWNYGLEKLLVNEPYIKLNRRKKESGIKLNSIRNNFIWAYKKSGKLNKLEVKHINKGSSNEFTTEIYNERSNLRRLQFESYFYHDMNFIPTDFQILSELHHKYLIDDILLSHVHKHFNVKLSYASYIIIIGTWSTALPFVIPSEVARGHKTDIYYTLYDLENWTVKNEDYYLIQNIPTKKNISLFLYDFMEQLNTPGQDD